MKKYHFFAVLFFSFSLNAFGQKDRWYMENWSPKNQSISADSAKVLLNTNHFKPKKKIVIAIIDGGIDVNHSAFKNILTINNAEIDKDGIDNDKNGYVDDLIGWNFLGLNRELNYEYVRIARKGRDYYVKNPNKGNGYKNYMSAEKYLSQELEKNIRFLRENKRAAFLLDSLRKSSDKTVDANMIEKFEPSSDYEKSLKNRVITFLNTGFSYEDIINTYNHTVGYFQDRLDKQLNLDYHPTYTKSGHNTHPSDFHGTHVSGIIANFISYFNVEEFVKILPITVIPSGDEYDEDVAAAIKYATDRGANIINLSFGKRFSSNPFAVKKAIAYGMRKGVLFIHAAGNEGEELSSANYRYPSSFVVSSTELNQWIEVGATKIDGRRFETSNYGKSVNIFAPGQNILSAAPNNEFAMNSGTSMAAPIISSIAAVVVSYFPDVDSKKIKQILLQNAIQTNDANAPLIVNMKLLIEKLIERTR